MTSQVSVEIVPADLAQIVASVFETMMGLEVSDLGAAEPWFLRGDRVISAVHLTGDWNGAVLIECNPVEACRLAARFLSMDPPPTVDDDVRDVLGELANMIGGNLKSLLTPGIQLSVPAVVDGRNCSLRICGAEVRLRLALHCSEGDFWVTVLATGA